MTDRERDVEAIRATYRRYRREGRSRIWDPSNRGYARMMRDRDAALVDLLRRSLPPREGHVLDLGSGDGRMAEVARAADLSIGSWVGVDLDPGAVATASAAVPWAEFVEAAADRLSFEDGSFDVVVASTLFSSLPTSELERAVASEIMRVLTPGGWLVSYDLRYGNPVNPAVHGLSRRRLKTLFSSWPIEARTMTLLPPLARRLGPMTGAAYRALELIPPLRSHLLARLQRPGSGRTATSR